MLQPRRSGYERVSNDLLGNDEIPVQQNCKSHTVYAFKDGCNNAKFSEDEEDDDENAIELTDLRSRNSTGKRSRDSAGISKSETVTHKISKSDSLQGISLLYGCTMAEIKQANGIYKEQDFHALKKLKIPVHQFSIHLEKKDEVKKSVSTATKSLRQLLDLPLPEGIEMEHTSDEIATSPLSCSSPGTEISVESYGNNTEGIQSFLKQVDKGINRACQHLDVAEDPGPGFLNAPVRMTNQEEKLGTICDISWRGFLMTLCVLAVVFPALGLLYYSYDKQSKRNKGL